MLIRSSFISLLMTASLTAAAPCDPISEGTEDRPEPVPEIIERVDLTLIPEESACGTGYKVEKDESGAVHIGFDDLISEAALGKYRAACRLAGTIVIPKGYRLDPSVALAAVIKGTLYGTIDNITGRLKFSLGRHTGRDFQLMQYSEPTTEELTQIVKMDLKAQLPDVPTSCTEDFTWSVSLFVESTINGKASSQIEEIRLDRLNLVPIDCRS
ncbi:hypothetical protein [Oligoflexus tunisiensis]|uniref:hypothetical protein n=1 Tax=Oligoflexus tunisiensis TaxID=708132 RepID=UPI00114CB697|nr:hypothetical protein [Oligoflexus tunisiensis]